MRKHHRCQIPQQLRTFGLGQFPKHLVNALALCIPHRTQPVAGHRARHGTRHVRNNEAQSATADAAHDAPEPARGRRGRALGEPLVAQHLLEGSAPLAVGGVGVGGPRAGDRGVGVAGGRRGGRGGAVGPAHGIVLAAPPRVRQRVVCVVDLLELDGAGGAFGGRGRNAVRVVLQRGALVRFPDLAGAGGGGDVEDGVVVRESWGWGGRVELADLTACEVWMGGAMGRNLLDEDMVERGER